MQRLLKQFSTPKTRQNLHSDGVKLVYAECMDDPDPDDFLSDKEILAAADAIAKHMGWKS